VSEQPADPLPAEEETTQFVVKSNQELCVCVCWYDCIMDQIDFLLDCALRVSSTCPIQSDPVQGDGKSTLILITALSKSHLTVQYQSQSQCQSHITTDSQSVSISWRRAQSGTFDKRFFSKLLSCLFGAPSLTRGRVCHMSVFVIEVYNSQSLFTTNIYIKLKIYVVLHTFTIQ
jgi:hypothetical protein